MNKDNTTHDPSLPPLADSEQSRADLAENNRVKQLYNERLPEYLALGGDPSLVGLFPGLDVRQENDCIAQTISFMDSMIEYSQLKSLRPLLPGPAKEAPATKAPATKVSAKTTSAKKKPSSRASRMNTSKWPVEQWKAKFEERNAILKAKREPRLTLTAFAAEKNVNVTTLCQMFNGKTKPGGESGTGGGLIAKDELNVFVEDTIMTNRSHYMNKGTRGPKKLSRTKVMNKLEEYFADLLPDKYSRNNYWKQKVLPKIREVLKSEEVDGEVARLGVFDETEELELLD